MPNGIIPKEPQAIEKSGWPTRATLLACRVCGVCLPCSALAKPVAHREKPSELVMVFVRQSRFLDSLRLLGITRSIADWGLGNESSDIP